MTPTARSMKYFRDLGCIVAGVEKTLHMPNAPFPMKRDCFGFGDLLVVLPIGCGISLVQVTDISSMSARRNKIVKGIAKDLENPKRVAEAIAARDNARAWLAAGGRIFLHGWGKRGPRGEKKKWVLREEEITYIYPRVLPRESVRVPGSERRTLCAPSARSRRKKPAVRNPAKRGESHDS
jgi:hypothetical protein